MRPFMFLSAVLTLTITLHSSQVCAAGDPNPGWPQVNGPLGNFNPRQYGHTLVDDLSQAKAVWISEDSDLGYAKTSSSGFVSNRATWPGHPGSANGLIAAEGMIFASSFRPAGGAWAENHPAAAAMSDYGPEEQKNLRRGLSIDADDFVVAIDMASGKTVWKAIEAGKGLFRGMGKRSGWGVTPVYHAGRVFSMGTTGRLYCYEAKTGKKVWETDIGQTHQAWEAEKRKHLEEKTLPSGGQYVSLVVAGGVLVVPLYDGLDVSLRGVDVETGKTLWEVPAATARTATPALWRHQGREYLLAATHGFGDHRQGKLRLIDPNSGKILWTVEGLGNTHFALAPSEKHVLVNVGSKTEFRDKKIDLRFDNPYVGCPNQTPPFEAQIWVIAGKPDRGWVCATPASGLQDQIPAGSNRAIDVGDTVLSDRGLHGTLRVPVGYHGERWELHAERDGNRLQGAYERRIEPLPRPFTTKGKLTGQVIGIADGSTTWELKLDAAIAKDEADMAAARNVYLEIDRLANGSVRVASKHGLTAANHEVDASQLTVGSDAIRGAATIIVHGDRWHAPNMHSDGALAATYKIDARIDGATIAGNYEGTVGVEYRRGGKVVGEVAAAEVAKR